MTRNGRRRFRLGRTRPHCMVLQSNQGSRRTDRISHPMDEIDIDEILSRSVSAYPFPWENVAVEDTQPHDMPVPFTINLLVNNENSGSGVNTRTSIDRMQGFGSLVPIDQVTSQESTTTRVPLEHAHDTEFSIDTNESHSGHQLNANSENDAHHRVYENTPIISNENNLPLASEGPAVINPGAATWSNQTNVVTDLPNPTRMPSPLCPEASDDQPNVQNPALVKTSIPPPMNLLAPKVSSPVDSEDESSEESVA